MNMSFMLVADFANIDSGGKLNVIGAFNRISARAFPALHPVMYLVVRLTAELVVLAAHDHHPQVALASA